MAVIRDKLDILNLSWTNEFNDEYVTEILLGSMALKHYREEDRASSTRIFCLLTKLKNKQIIYMDEKTTQNLN
jgi:hypothetical protein